MSKGAMGEYLTCQRKRKHRSQEQAEAHCIRLYLRTGRRGLGVYRCPYCHLLHVGRLSRKCGVVFDLDKKLGV